MNLRGVALLLAGLAALIALFFAFRPAATPVAAPASPSASAVPMPAPPKIFELTIHDGVLARGPAVIAVTEGDEVALRVTSNRDDELHLHGYDLHLALKAGVPAELRFTADRSGRFDYELHHAHAGLGALEVQPK